MVTIAFDPTLPWQIQRATLDDVEYLLVLSWNTRDSRWYLEVQSSGGTPIVSGIAIVVDYPLLDRFGYSTLPPGRLIAVDTTDGGEIAAQEDLGTRVQLVYLTLEEVLGG